MASFTRGLCLPGICRAVLTPEISIIRSRLFTTSLRFRAAEPALKAARPSPAPRAAPHTSAIAPSRYAFIKSLATKPTPTVLYEGPSHFWFYFGCWTSGITILSWTALTAPWVTQQPEGVPQWVSVVFGASYLLLGSMGFYLISKTPNIVGTIRVIPSQAAKLASSVSATTTAATATGPLPLQMEVTVKRMVPYLQPKVLTTSLDKVTLKSRFSLPDEYVPQLRRIEIQRAQEAQKKALRKFDMEHLLTMPFRQLGRAFQNMFHGVKSAWTDMGYGIIEVNGKKYKVDVTKGFAHDGFRTLEKIVDIKP
ncbi:Fc.00g110270.m01.CDS01 [Cosmosporella sp. VM-42]